jgi:hypothetical protein
MQHERRHYLRWAFLASLILIALSGWLAVFVERMDAAEGVYESSQIVNQYWHYKHDHGDWPAAGSIYGYDDAHFLRSVSESNGSRKDVFSFGRSRHIVIELAWKDDLFARLEAE